MKTFLLSLAGAFAALILFSVFAVLSLGAFVSAAGAAPDKPDKIVLVVDLRADMTDQRPTAGLAAFSGMEGFIDLMAKLDAAADDDAVKGVFLRAPDFGYPAARAEELRAALKAVKASGKFVVAHTQGVFSTSPSALRAIAVADQIWAQPGSDLMSAGVSFETPFAGGLFDNLSISPEYIALYEYKETPNLFTESDYTEPHREAITALAESVWKVSLDDIAADRVIDAAKARAVLDARGDADGAAAVATAADPADAMRAFLEGSPYVAEELVEVGLFDEMGWPEDALEAALERGDGAEAVKIKGYAPPPAAAGAPVIAVVGGEGPIVAGGGDSDLFADTDPFASDRVAKSLLDAGRDKRAKAVIFRVDSPGGSPAASEQIWRAVERVQEMGKPVVVSMGGVAASGGYYVSAGADRIVANRSTITGSIGIFAGKFAIAEGLARIGVNLAPITVGGDFAGALSADVWTEEQRAEMRRLLTNGYDRFAEIVGEGRGLSAAEVDKAARGRVWSGEDAAAVGLVDSLGGFLHAVEVAKELAEIEADTRPRLIYFPAPKSGFDALQGGFSVSSDAGEAAAVLSAIGRNKRLSEALDQAANAGAGGHERAVGPLLIER